MGCPYTALDAFLTEQRLCRLGLAEPDMRGALVTLACSCGAEIEVSLPPLPAQRYPMARRSGLRRLREPHHGHRRHGYERVPRIELLRAVR